jgi:hypothetical protein
MGGKADRQNLPAARQRMLAARLLQNLKKNKVFN